MVLLCSIHAKHFFAKNQHPSSRTLRIAVGGAGHHVGVTTFALALTNYLSGKCGQKGGYVELNPTRQIASVSGKETQRRPFEFCGFRIWPEATFASAEEICGSGYNYYVLDYGVVNANNAQRFLREEVQIVIGSIAPWNTDSFPLMLRALYPTAEKSKKGKCVFFLAPEGKGKLLEKVRKRTGLPLEPLPVLKDPFQLSASDWPLFERIVSETFIPHSNDRERRKVFI